MTTLTASKKAKLASISIDAKLSIRDAFAKMDTDNVRLLCLFTDDKYSGILSAGDIQRAIIGNLPLDTPSVEVLRKEGVRVAHVDEDFDSIKGLMLQFRTEFMPVLNDRGELENIYFWDEVFAHQTAEKPQLNVPVVIMAGGKGTRLKPFSNILPKPLFPLGDRTILETIMDKFEDVGCHRFLLSVNYRHEY